MAKTRKRWSSKNINKKKKVIFSFLNLIKEKEVVDSRILYIFNMWPKIDYLGIQTTISK